MAKRTDGQRTGSRGQAIVSLIAEESETWIARRLDEDFGIDLELELDSPEVRGELLKVQIKSTSDPNIDRQGQITLKVETKYLRYAEACRYPVIFVLAETSSRRAWWLWLQRWLIEQDRLDQRAWRDQTSVSIRIPLESTLSAGLQDELKHIARWEGEYQLALSLLDCMRAAIGYERYFRIADPLVELVAAVEPSQLPIELVVRQAIELGDQLRGGQRGNAVANLLYTLCRQCGARFDVDLVQRMVRRGEGYSRTGINALGFLYNHHYEHVAAMKLPTVWGAQDDPRIAYYCLLREAHREIGSPAVLEKAGDFEANGLRADLPDGFFNKWANRGDSAVLDYLRHIAEGDVEPA